MPTNTSTCPASGPSARGPGLAGHVHSQAYTHARRKGWPQETPTPPYSYTPIPTGYAYTATCMRTHLLHTRARRKGWPQETLAMHWTRPDQIRVISESDPYLSSRAGDGRRRLLLLQAAPRWKMAHSVSSALTRAPQSRPVSRGPLVTAL